MPPHRHSRPPTPCREILATRPGVDTGTDTPPLGLDYGLAPVLSTRENILLTVKKAPLNGHARLSDNFLGEGGITTAGAPVAGSSPNRHVVVAPQNDVSTDPFACAGSDRDGPAPLRKKVSLGPVHHR